MRKVLVVFSAMLLFAAASQAATPGVNVSPSSGSRHGPFTVSFAAPQKSGGSGLLLRRYVVSADGPAGAHGCQDSVTRSPAAPHAHARVRVKLGVRAGGGGWCTGTFHGVVQEIAGPNCPTGKLCPAFPTAIKTIGRFTFHVRAAAAH